MLREPFVDMASVSCSSASHSSGSSLGADSNQVYSYSAGHITELQHTTPNKFTPSKSLSPALRQFHKPNHAISTHAKSNSEDTVFERQHLPSRVCDCRCLHHENCYARYSQRLFIAIKLSFDIVATSSKTKRIVSRMQSASLSLGSRSY